MKKINPIEEINPIEIEKKKEFLANLARIKGDEATQEQERYLWLKNELSIYVDDEHRFMLVHFSGQLVCSTVPSSGLPFVDGEWWKLVEPYLGEINSIVNAEKATRITMMAREF